MLEAVAVTYCTWDDYLYEDGRDNTGNVWSEVCVCDECHNKGREEGDERGVGVKLTEKKHNIIPDNARQR